MSKLYFKYSTMFSGKTSELIKTYTTYEIQGKTGVVIKPSIDTRGNQNTIKSRSSDYEIKNVLLIHPEEDVSKKIVESVYISEVDVILIDEAQFLTREQVIQLHDISIMVPVVCFGLKTDAQGRLFEGSNALLSFADSIEEIKGICEVCNKKSTMNLLVDENNKVVFDSNPITIGSDNFHALCYHHWNQARKIGEYVYN